MQRGNLDMVSLANFDFYNQVSEASLLGTAYLWRDYDHMRATFDIDVLDQLIAKREEATPPAGLEGLKLRKPHGEGWQSVGEALGATPTPLAFTEVYTALQTGAAQDNPLPANWQMKFHEGPDQIVLIGHLIANNVCAMAVSKWESLSEEQQSKVFECARTFQDALARMRWTRTPSRRKLSWLPSSRARG
jgi:TRAP-type transport system periplasmic protein